ncbi:MAG TPA: hypothetical protein VGE63_00025 [Candidatus Paceibacterota bacterium]
MEETSKISRERKSLRTSIAQGYDLTKKTSKRVLKKNLEKIQGHVFDTRAFVISLLLLGSLLLLLGSFVLLSRRNSITIKEIQHGAITEQIITKHRTRQGIEYLVVYPQFSAPEASFGPLNEIIRDGVEVFLREHVWDARKDFLYQGAERVQTPYSINIGYKDGLINEDVISVSLRLSAHLPGERRIEDAQTYTYDVQKKKLVSLAELVGEKQEFYDDLRTQLIDAVTIIFDERNDMYEIAQQESSFGQKQELFFSRNALKNLNFMVVDGGFVFYVPEEVIKTDSLGFLEIPYQVKS